MKEKRKEDSFVSLCCIAEALKEVNSVTSLTQYPFLHLVRLYLSDDKTKVGS